MASNVFKICAVEDGNMESMLWGPMSRCSRCKINKWAHLYVPLSSTWSSMLSF